MLNIRDIHTHTHTLLHSISIQIHYYYRDNNYSSSSISFHYAITLAPILPNKILHISCTIPCLYPINYRFWKFIFHVNSLFPTSFNLCDRTTKTEKNCFEINNVNCCNCFEIDENKKFDLCDIERENELLNKLMNSNAKIAFLIDAMTLIENFMKTFNEKNTAFELKNARLNDVFLKFIRCNICHIR